MNKGINVLLQTPAGSMMKMMKKKRKKDREGKKLPANQVQLPSHMHDDEYTQLSINTIMNGKVNDKSYDHVVGHMTYM